MERLEGQRVERLEGRMLGRLEGLRVENLMEAYTFHNSFLIPSTHKFFVGDLRSPTTNKIYSPGFQFLEYKFLFFRSTNNSQDELTLT